MARFKIGLRCKGRANRVIIDIITEINVTFNPNGIPFNPTNAKWFISIYIVKLK